MEFLKELFAEGQALTYDQLAKSAKDKGIEVVNAAGGAYVPKGDVDNLNATINTLKSQAEEANKKLEGYDPGWKTKAEEAERKLQTQEFDFALDKALTLAKAKDPVAVKAHLDREKLSYVQGKIIGLDEQLAPLRKGEVTSAYFEPETKIKTGLSHQGGREVGSTGDSKKDEANAALRALFGHGED